MGRVFLWHILYFFSNVLFQQYTEATPAHTTHMYSTCTTAFQAFFCEKYCISRCGLHDSYAIFAVAPLTSPSPPRSPGCLSCAPLDTRSSASAAIARGYISPPSPESMAMYVCGIASFWEWPGPRSADQISPLTLTFLVRGRHVQTRKSHGTLVRSQVCLWYSFIRLLERCSRDIAEFVMVPTRGQTVNL